MTHEHKGKIKGKFYPLQNEEWLKACKELKPAERDVLYYLRTLDPFGDGELELGVSVIALALGRDKGTVSRALKALEQKGWIDLQLLKVKVKLHSHPPTSKLSPHNRVVSTQPSCLHTTELSPHNRVVSTQQNVVSTQQNVVSTQQSSPETRSGQEVSLSKTYIDFKDSLSEETREKFWAFVRKEVKNFPRPISDLESWLASETKAGEKRWQVYYEKYKQQKQPQEKAPKRRRLHEEIEQRKRELEEREKERLANQEEIARATG